MLIPHQSSKAEKIYYKLKDKLEKKYSKDNYVVINPDTKDYFVGKTSVEAMKKARNKFHKGPLFMAQIGRISGLMK
ncbi:hypothetical protein A3D78_03105 [Candidatus Gottesmanbacteria bacterium RIFCSPHIGHO2_02_FULL_39_14]|uniref:DUF5678 domain-containing protein n=1 Tax=Candidatus Gottesmanbacteria bacterium RIFCSPHIGHO2_02_FULL_39_14 TaxID=1798383 RepID=A0A1F5ZXP3_9BACT|nr:MAG: hypothetical protein A3D78_03105 [Candidatus Gottesmanbacteria bacterium RIFCSPHIGHO2_02_FULL_39_14]